MWNWIGIGLIRGSNYTGLCSGNLSHYDINVGRIVRLFLLAKCLLWARPGLPTMHLDVGHWQLQHAAGSRQQGRGRRQEAPCKRLVNVVACRLFNCGPSVTHSHSHSLITSSSSGKFYLNKLWYMEISGDCWMAMGVGMGMGSGCGCESRRRMTETIPKR